ncbi:MAG TPA: YtxH domain-containing protein [Ignavibacteria bacterium]|nr:YtxH domain-containing protein [Ignavibacteria bacterium]HRF65556.1 YtxH domain-containing protein [Ignavibacteria bacterium]HRJ02948.1 YtxH domain-containing protein [Ignavibacteria bacterium]HRJ84185.1 YtxH domain-containing protein [Ignavibacteria bacterium]
MEDRTSSTKGFLLGLLAGGAIGGLTALLYAPKSGRELRKDIGKKGREVIKETEHYVDNAKTKASEILSESRRKAESLLSDARKKADSITKGTEKLYSQGKEFITDEAVRLKEAVRAGVDTFNEEKNKTR